ncbi:YceD family protein [Mycolicibacterium frederiksbergense]|jgi:uncharacterized protein|uniref:YceD family protein n=1 Tax=Mycolicibacterium frederiksbergense TaxID=117567 RepID=UPI00265C683E|nr:DUF177 domain-containing protein [Mycolicibacterium frederiksbergense]MBX9919613.1 DUF177 domain-containing protein [Mycolicibacterium frederiksbergense]MDO0977463.1 DUF177 domain-containing protein [Mycolicibacterium frederiksbergense]
MAGKNPLAIDISRLGLRPGSMIEVHETVPSPSRIGLDLIRIEQGAPLELDLRIESVSEGALVTGTVSGPITGECVRCLEPVSDEVSVDITELFAYPGSTTEATTEDDEVGHVVDDRVHIEQSLVDAVGLVLPFSPMCREDCAGLCPDCGVALADAEPGHTHDKIDPRWAKLAALKDQVGDASDG